MDEEYIAPNPTEQQEMANFVAGYPETKEREGIFNFLTKVYKGKNTTKVSNLDDQELDNVRIFQDTAIFADEMQLEEVAEYLRKKAEVILATADSKSGFLINAAVTSKKQLETKSTIGGGKK